MRRKVQPEDKSKNMTAMSASASSPPDRVSALTKYNRMGEGGKPEAHDFRPGLYIVATPIGNARDITLRALDLLACADIIACEDTRVTRKLLNIHNINRPTMAYHDHNAQKVRPRLLKHLNEGKIVALVSDAGTPLISDPGYRLVREVRDAGLNITALPGASAALAALASAGLPTDCFLFFGFLPAKGAARRKALAAVAKAPATLVFYESAGRLAASLADMAVVLGGRQAAVMRELTKKFEEARFGDLDNLASHYGDTGPPKGEIVVLVAPEKGTAGVLDQDAIDTLLRGELMTRRIKDAAAAVAKRTGLRRRDLYNRALRLREEE